MRRREQGSSAVEFAIVVPVLMLLVFGIIDFGLMFGGYYGLENAVEGAARAAAVGQYQYNGATSCGSTTATGQLVCQVASEAGSLTGTVNGTLKVGICFIGQGASASGCSTESGPGTSVSQDVEVCAQVTLRSSTGITAPFLSGKTATASSRLVIEQPQPTGSTAYSAFNSSSSSVTYGSWTIQGMNCS